jgi:hypothetical protein
VLNGFIYDAARRVVLLDRRAATDEEEETLQYLEENGWAVVEWRDAVALTRPKVTAS